MGVAFGIDVGNNGKFDVVHDMKAGEISSSLKLGTGAVNVRILIIIPRTATASGQAAYGNTGYSFWECTIPDGMVGKLYVQAVSMVSNGIEADAGN